MKYTGVEHMLLCVFLASSDLGNHCHTRGGTASRQLPSPAPQCSAENKHALQTKKLGFFQLDIRFFFPSKEKKNIIPDHLPFLVHQEFHETLLLAKQRDNHSAILFVFNLFTSLHILHAKNFL